MRRIFFRTIVLMVALFVFWPSYERLNLASQRSLATYPRGGEKFESLEVTYGVAVRLGPLISPATSQPWHRIRLGLFIPAVTIDLHSRPAVFQMRFESLSMFANVVTGVGAGFLMAGVASAIRAGRSPQLKDGETEGE